MDNSLPKKRWIFRLVLKIMSDEYFGLFCNFQNCDFLKSDFLPNLPESLIKIQRCIQDSAKDLLIYSGLC